MVIGPKDSVIAFSPDGKIKIAIAENPETDDEVQHGTIIMALASLIADANDKLAKLIDTQIEKILKEQNND